MNSCGEIKHFFHIAWPENFILSMLYLFLEKFYSHTSIQKYIKSYEGFVIQRQRFTYNCYRNTVSTVLSCIKVCSKSVRMYGYQHRTVNWTTHCTHFDTWNFLTLTKSLRETIYMDFEVVNSSDSLAISHVSNGKRNSIIHYRIWVIVGATSNGILTLF